ncbi:Mov34/MPN/PAD-1 family protein [Deinococcus petrolearius]|uniref:Mov34/MPN/PAD-1 family protein n=1 Tax=Deinococcus petrolearius TaxID=1751295 RepID=A0ABW1DHQ1_9DEIO
MSGPAPCPTLHLPEAVAAGLWAQARQAAPHECVGALGGEGSAPLWRARALYPLANVSMRPETEYLADPGGLLRALRAMEAAGLTLVALYHSHPRGPARPSDTDRRRAAYDVPYLIADLAWGELRAFLLPGGEPVALHVD